MFLCELQNVSDMSCLDDLIVLHIFHILLLRNTRAECEDRLRAEFRIEMNAAVAESEQRWQNKEQELQTKVSELQAELRKEQLRVGLLHRAAATTTTTTTSHFNLKLCHKCQEKVFQHFL